MEPHMSRRSFLKRSGLAAASAAAAGAAPTRAEETRPETRMPRIRLGSLEVSRLILGSNPFWGYAHKGGDVAQRMRDYYTDDRIMDTLDEAAALGVTAVATPPHDRWLRLWKAYRDRGGKMPAWIAQPDGQPEQMEEEVSRAVEASAAAVFIQGERADTQFRDGHFDTLRRWLEHVKALGVPAGLASHRPDTHPEYERRGLPADFYFQCFYVPDDYRTEDRQRAVDTIRALEKPVVGYKVLAAGRLSAQEGLSFAFRHLRTKDGACVGVFPADDPNQMAENARLVRELSRG